MRNALRVVSARFVRLLRRVRSAADCPVEVLIGHLQAVGCRNSLAVAHPLTNHVHGKRFGELGFPSAPEVSEHLRPRLQACPPDVDHGGGGSCKKCWIARPDPVPAGGSAEGRCAAGRRDRLLRSKTQEQVLPVCREPFGPSGHSENLDRKRCRGLESGQRSILEQAHRSPWEPRDGWVYGLRAARV